MASAVMTDAYKALNKSRKAEHGDDPQYAMFRTCVEGLLKAEPVAEYVVVCDLSEQFACGCIKMFNKIRHSGLHQAKDRLFGIMFADDTVHPGVQAADMVAYCARQDARRGVEKPFPVVDVLIQKLRISFGKAMFGNLT